MNAATTKSGGKSSEITPLTRRRIVAELDRISLSGELPEIEFLKKVWPIDTIPSPHPGGRERTMEDYLVRHRIANHDMSNREVLEALGINTCPQEKIFRLLEQVLDPLIREFPQQMELASRLNRHLNLDGFSLEKTGSMSGSPIFNVQPVRPVGSGTMRVSDKLVLIDKIGRALQAKFTYSEIDAFLQEFEIPLPEKAGTNSKWVYSKSALQGVPEDILLKIAQELDLEIPRSQRTVAGPPRNWMGATHFRLFISHISKDKDNAIKTQGLPRALCDQRLRRPRGHTSNFGMAKRDRARLICDGCLHCHPHAWLFGQRLDPTRDWRRCRSWNQDHFVQNGRRPYWLYIEAPSFELRKTNCRTDCERNRRTPTS